MRMLSRFRLLLFSLAAALLICAVAFSVSPTAFVDVISVSVPQAAASPFTAPQEVASLPVVIVLALAILMLLALAFHDRGSRPMKRDRTRFQRTNCPQLPAGIG